MLFETPCGLSKQCVDQVWDVQNVSVKINKLCVVHYLQYVKSKDHHPVGCVFGLCDLCYSGCVLQSIYCSIVIVLNLCVLHHLLCMLWQGPPPGGADSQPTCSTVLKLQWVTCLLSMTVPTMGTAYNITAVQYDTVHLLYFFPFSRGACQL